MSNTDTEDKHPHPHLAWVGGLAAILGTIIVIITDLTGSFLVEGYSPISDTISDLAAGDPLPLMDIGLQMFGGGMMLVAVGLYLWQRDGWQWKLSCFLLFLLGIDIIILAQRDVYGDGVPTGTEIHIYLVYFLGIAFALIAWFAGEGLKDIAPKWKTYSRGTAVAWLLLGPIFFIAHDSWDGAYERFLALFLVVWVVVVARLLVRHRHGIRS